MKIEIKLFILFLAIASTVFCISSYTGFNNLYLSLLSLGLATALAALAAYSYNCKFIQPLIKNLEETTAIKDRMASELKVAQSIQMNMLTLTLPAFPKHKNLDLSAYLKPARELGGDFYDFYFFREGASYLLEDNQFCFCVGDVSGKGVPASLFMAVIKILLKSQVNQDFSPARILTHVNQIISLDNPSCMFVTLFFGILNLTNGELIYTNAGHNPPYIRRFDGSLEILNQRHGPILGVLEDITYQESRVTLNTGDILIAYTDGVTEAMNEAQDLFSDERFVELLKSPAFNSVENIVKLTAEAVSQFQGKAEQSDDITLLSLQFLGQTALPGELLELAIKNELFSSLREQWD